MCSTWRGGRTLSVFGTSLLLALKEIRRHTLRSFLTTLGIIIGVASVVTMVSLGNGATQSVQAQVSSLGTNLLTIRPGGEATVIATGSEPTWSPDGERVAFVRFD